MLELSLYISHEIFKACDEEMSQICFYV